MIMGSFGRYGLVGYLIVVARFSARLACQDVLMAISKADEAELAAKFAVMRPFLDERAWRVYLGTEANAMGYGGVAAVARASGASETTVAAGGAQVREPEALEPGRSRRPGAGRPKAGDRQPGLRGELDGLLEEGRRGD